MHGLKRGTSPIDENEPNYRIEPYLDEWDVIIELVCKLPQKHRSIPFKNDFVNGDF